MNFRAMTQQDLDFTAEHSINRGVLKNQPKETDLAYTLEHEGNVLIVGGFKLINHTSALCWLSMTCFAGDHIIMVFRTIKEWIEILCKEKGIQCLMAFVDAGFEAGETTVRHLGFEKQCRIRNYSDTGPADLWIKYFEVSK
jgi:hypothetical protein